MLAFPSLCCSSSRGVMADTHSRSSSPSVVDATNVEAFAVEVTLPGSFHTLGLSTTTLRLAAPCLLCAFPSSLSLPDRADLFFPRAVTDHVGRIAAMPLRLLESLASGRPAVPGLPWILSGTRDVRYLLSFSAPFVTDPLLFDTDPFLPVASPLPLRPPDPRRSPPAVPPPPRVRVTRVVLLPSRPLRLAFHPLPVIRQADGGVQPGTARRCGRGVGCCARGDAEVGGGDEDEGDVVGLGFEGGVKTQWVVSFICQRRCIPCRASKLFEAPAPRQDSFRCCSAPFSRFPFETLSRCFPARALHNHSSTMTETTNRG